MKRLVGALTIIIIILGVVSGFLFYQNSEMQNLNSELSNQNSEIQNQLDEQQIQNSELENQIINLQNRSSELDAQIFELENRVNELESPVYDVKIISLSVIENINTPVGVALFFDAYITIKNNGNNAVTGLVIFLKRIGGGEIYGDYLLGEGYALLDTIQPGEEKEIHAEIETNLGLAWKVKPIIHTATLRLGTIIVDKYTLS